HERQCQEQANRHQHDERRDQAQFLGGERQRPPALARFWSRRRVGLGPGVHDRESPPTTRRYLIGVVWPRPAATSSSSSRIARCAAGSSIERSGIAPSSIIAVSAARARPTRLLIVP